MAFYGFDLQPSWVWPASMRVSQWRPFGNWWIEIIALILGGFTKDLISDLENDQFLGPNFSKVAFNLHSCWLESSFPLFQVPELESPYYPKLSCIKSENELPQIARPELLHIYTLVEFLIKIHQFSRWICSQFGKNPVPFSASNPRPVVKPRPVWNHWNLHPKFQFWMFGVLMRVTWMCKNM